MEIFYTAFATIAVTVLSGVLLDFLRNGRPKVVYSVKDCVPIDLDNSRTVGAYVVSLRNASKRVVKDIECHMEGASTKLRNGGISAPQGMQYSIEEYDNILRFTAPYLKRDESIIITVIAEGRGYIPRHLSVAVRSPHELNIVLSDTPANRRATVPTFLLAASIASAVGAVAAMIETTDFNSEPRDTLMFASAASNLPHLAEIYATESSINYYNQADLVCALALADSPLNHSEIEKYQTFLSLILELQPQMWNSSKANIYYCRGKLNLRIGDKSNAILDFKKAIALSQSTVSRKSSIEAMVRNFLYANGMVLSRGYDATKSP
jgi:tetratricopeptide (TPR) repeat protein